MKLKVDFVFFPRRKARDLDEMTLLRAVDDRVKRDEELPIHLLVLKEGNGTKALYLRKFLALKNDIGGSSKARHSN